MVSATTSASYSSWIRSELLARVDHLGGDGAEVLGLAPHDVVVLAGLAEVDGERDDLGVVLVLDQIGTPRARRPPRRRRRRGARPCPARRRSPRRAGRG